MSAKSPTLLDRLANALGYVKGVALTTSAAMGFKEYPREKTEEELAAYVSWVFGCVNARSTDVSHIRMRLYKVVNRNKKEVEEVTEHDSLSLLRSVNPFMTAAQLFQYTQAFKDLTGEAFWYLQRAGRNGNGVITQIWLLRPDYVDIKTSEDGFLSGYVYKVPGKQPQEFKPEEIIHHKEFNPLNPYRGLSVVRAAAVTIDTEVYSEEYNKKFFRNSAVPEVVLKTEQKLNDQQVKRMHAEWQNKYGGTQNAHKTAILEGGIEVQAFSMSQKDMEFLAGMGFSRDKILALFQVPKSRLGMTEGVTVSNAEATINIYLKYCVKPLMQSVRDALNEFLLPLYPGTEDMFFEIDDPVPQDMKARVEQMQAQFAMGALTPNEVRGEFGRDEVEGLDGFYLPIAQQPIAGEAGAPAPVVGEDGKQVKTKRNMRPKVDAPHMRLKDRYAKKIAKDVGEEVHKQIMSSIGTVPRFARKEGNLGRCMWKEETKEAFWKQLTAKTDSREVLFKKRVVELFDKQERETLSRLASAEKSVQQKLSQSDIESIIISVSAENKIAAEFLLPLVREILEEAGNDSLDFIEQNTAFDATTESVRQFLRRDALKGIRVMNKVTKSKLRSALADAIAEGVGPVVAARRIRDVFDEARQVRAERVARTEILKAANRGTLEAYKQSGVVAGKEWFTALDERVCQWCAPLHGKVQGLDQDFFSKGETYVGNKGGVIRFNLEDIPTPPLHPNCRCTLLPITTNQRSAKRSDESGRGEMDEAEKAEMRAQVRAELREEVAQEMLREIDEMAHE